MLLLRDVLAHLVLLWRFPNIRPGEQKPVGDHFMPMFPVTSLEKGSIEHKPARIGDSIDDHHRGGNRGSESASVGERIWRAAAGRRAQWRTGSRTSNSREANSGGIGTSHGYDNSILRNMHLIKQYGGPVELITVDTRREAGAEDGMQSSSSSLAAAAASSPQLGLKRRSAQSKEAQPEPVAVAARVVGNAGVDIPGKTLSVATFGLFVRWLWRCVAT